MATTKPAHTLRYGRIQAAIWRNETQNGPRLAVTVQRVYKDGEQWKSTQCFDRDDLLLLAKVANEAHSWIVDNVRKND